MLNPNFLILDEPTNDLDIFAMSVLEEYLRSFQGSLIVVSHDRYFMDKMVDHLFVFQGEGQIKDITGNYHTYRTSLQSAQRQQKQDQKTAPDPIVEQVSAPAEKQRKMSFKEKQEFEQIEKMLPQLETEKEQLSSELSSGNLSNEQLLEKGARLGLVVDQIDEFTLRWLELSELA
jgi:ATP-binding cassette subfamily F protein uup